MDRHLGSRSVVSDKAYRFAIRVVNAYRYLTEERKEYVLSKQFLRCGTCISANCAEAQGSISTNDFSAKFSIAYKECLETKYWISLLKDTGYFQWKAADSLLEDANEITKTLFFILKTTQISS
jgi:four helix bundle protein